VAILAGIDEAGYGPVLGPLVVSSVAMVVPDELAGRCLWQALAGGVTRAKFRASPALPIADSKDLRIRTDGLVHVERGVLGLLSQGGDGPATLRALLETLAPGAAAKMDGYPWYRDADLPLPAEADSVDLRLRANGLTQAMRRVGLRLAGVRCEPVFAGEFNRLVSATRNKSVALFGVVARLMSLACRCRDGGRPTEIVIDRQGGRTRYVPSLMTAFPTAELKILREDELRSEYRMRLAGRDVLLRFVVGGETECLPVAAASMVSKYVRELLMLLLNRWYAGRVDGLRPTAGYHGDGNRFVRDVSGVLRRERVDRDLFIRQR
jgi:hypothetical protein